MRVAIVHDWLYGGGAERVVLELHRMYPNAPIYTSFCTDEWRQKLDNKVVTGYLQYRPFRKFYKFLPLLRQWWFKRLNLREFDLVIATTGNGEAKFARAPNGKLVCYCFTPVHFYWRHYEEYLQNPGFKPAWLARLGLKLVVNPLRKRDYRAAQKVDQFISISTHIQNDIKQFYNRVSDIVYPPVDVERFTSVEQPKTRSGFVTMGRQVPMKRTDLIIQACNKLNVPLTVIGRGPENTKLSEIAGPTVKLKTDVSDEQMPAELASAEAFLFASFEDFGIAPIEAMAAGTPVIAYKAGGALDYVIPNKTGAFFKDQTVDSLVAALIDFRQQQFDSQIVQKEATTFSAQNFQAGVQSILARMR